MAAVTKQPEVVMMQAPSVQVTVPVGMPMSMAYFASLSKVNIYQVFNMVEVLTGCELVNRYRVCNEQEQQFFYVKEDTDFCTRYCFGNIRPFVINVTDNQGQVVMVLSRPLRCQGACCCCCLQEMDIECPPGNIIAKIKEDWTCWTPKYTVEDAVGTEIFKIDGPCAYCMCCTDIPFKVSNADRSIEVGCVTKHWTGCREICGGVNDFSVSFPQDMDVLQKAILFGSTFLVDFMYFERQKNQ